MQEVHIWYIQSVCVIAFFIWFYVAQRSVKRKQTHAVVYSNIKIRFYSLYIVKRTRRVISDAARRPRHSFSSALPPSSPHTIIIYIKSVVFICTLNYSRCSYQVFFSLSHSHWSAKCTLRVYIVRRNFKRYIFNWNYTKKKHRCDDDARSMQKKYENMQWNLCKDFNWFIFGESKLFEIDIMHTARTTNSLILLNAHINTFKNTL